MLPDDAASAILIFAINLIRKDHWFERMRCQYIAAPEARQIRLQTRGSGTPSGIASKMQGWIVIVRFVIFFIYHVD